jgi:hypothetical protein
MTVPEALNQISLCAANFGNAEAFGDVLEDWIAFLGARPAEIVIVDGGSSPQTHAVYWNLFQAGRIDKLQVIRQEHPDNHRDTCYVQEHAAMAISSGKYVLCFKSDTLPFRAGHDDWIVRAIECLDRPDTFAVGGSFNLPSRHHDGPWPGWYFSAKCSLNFALMKRQSFVSAMTEFGGAYIASNFTLPSPVPDDGKGSTRYFIETALETYMKNHGLFTLAKVEDASWTVFHTNATGAELAKVRRDYQARKDVRRYMNAGLIQPLLGGCFYGKKRDRMKELRVAWGNSPLGPPWRAVKRWLGVGQRI